MALMVPGMKQALQEQSLEALTLANNIKAISELAGNRELHEAAKAAVLALWNLRETLQTQGVGEILEELQELEAGVEDALQELETRVKGET